MALHKSATSMLIGLMSTAVFTMVVAISPMATAVPVDVASVVPAGKSNLNAVSLGVTVLRRRRQLDPFEMALTVLVWALSRASVTTFFNPVATVGAYTANLYLFLAEVFLS